MSQMLVDTSVWFALLCRSDQYHSRAEAILSQPDRSVVTPWPVVWETVTLMVARTSPGTAADVGRRFLRGLFGDLVPPTDADHIMALALIENFPRLRLSAVDAHCCAIARRLGIPEVASFDGHFAQVLTERTVVGPE